MATPSSKLGIRPDVKVLLKDVPKGPGEATRARLWMAYPNGTSPMQTEPSRDADGATT